jgi:hypothetical protein
MKTCPPLPPSKFSLFPLTPPHPFLPPTTYFFSLIHQRLPAYTKRLADLHIHEQPCFYTHLHLFHLVPFSLTPSLFPSRVTDSHSESTWRGQAFAHNHLFVTDLGTTLHSTRINTKPPCSPNLCFILPSSTRLGLSLDPSNRHNTHIFKL